MFEPGNGPADNDQPKDAHNDQHEEIGVALSGGGLRAALYSAGALLYLVHSGVNRRVKLISSVSGGSLTNAVVMLHSDFSTVDRQYFDFLMGRMCVTFSTLGIQFFASYRGAWKLLMITVAICTACLTWLAVQTNDPRLFTIRIVEALTARGIPKEWAFVIAVPTAVAVGVFIGFFIAWFLRKPLQKSLYDLIVRWWLNPYGFRHIPARSIDKLDKREVAHIFCATELTSGNPMLISQYGMSSLIFGRSRKSHLSVGATIYASAAFPLIFPPLRIRSRRRKFAGGRNDNPPRNLYLADGGVFNNLGTDGLGVYKSPEHAYLVDADEQLVPAVRRNLVINVSAPPSVRRLGPIKAIRTMSVLYESTLEPRIAQLMIQQGEPDGPIVIDVAESPVELTERIRAGRTPTDPIAKRASESASRLRKIFKDSEWKERAVDAARTKTVLSAVNRNSAIRLVTMGYINAATACNAHLGAPGLDIVPAPEWFADLLDHKILDLLYRGDVTPPYRR